MAGVITQAVGGFVKTFADETANQANMEIAMQNRQIALSKAAQAGMIGNTKASMKAAEGTAREGAITQKAAASGVDVSGSGSVQRAKEDSAVMNARDIQAIKYGAANDMFGYQMKARDEEIKVETAKQRSMLIPFENLLGVASSAASSGYASGAFSVGGGGDGGGWSEHGVGGTHEGYT
jgi:hypothetical protein